MSNIPIYPANGSGVPANLTPYVFQSSNPEDLQAQLQDLIDQMIGGGISGGLYEINITGAGDGHSFVVSVFVDSAGGSPVDPTVVQVYMAASAPELALAQTQALAALTEADVDVLAHGLAGASQGRRWCGLFLGVSAG